MQLRSLLVVGFLVPLPLPPEKPYAPRFRQQDCLVVVVVAVMMVEENPTLHVLDENVE